MGNLIGPRHPREGDRIIVRHFQKRDRSFIGGVRLYCNRVIVVDEYDCDAELHENAPYIHGNFEDDGNSIVVEMLNDTWEFVS